MAPRDVIAVTGGSCSIIVTVPMHPPAQQQPRSGLMLLSCYLGRHLRARAAVQALHCKPYTPCVSMRAENSCRLPASGRPTPVVLLSRQPYHRLNTGQPATLPLSASEHRAASNTADSMADGKHCPCTDHDTQDRVRCCSTAFNSTHLKKS